MSDPRPHRGGLCSDRIRLLARADELFSRGADLIRSKEAGHAFSWEFSGDAARVFDQAAVIYGDLGLGIKARDAWSRSASCHRSLAMESERLAQLCDDRRNAIPVLWTFEPGDDS